MSVGRGVAVRVGLAAWMTMLATLRIVSAAVPGVCSGSDFSNKFYASPPVSNPMAFAIGDFDEDTHEDVLLVAGGLFLYRGNGRGSLRSPIEVGVTSGRSVAIADFNNDGHLDAAFAAQDESVTVAFGTGTGTFRSGVKYPVAGASISIVAADLNGDGIPDLAVATWYRGSINILLNRGDGSFSAVTEVFGAGRFHFSIEAADFNNDGRTDLVVTGEQAPYASVFLNRGDAIFGAPIVLDTAGRPGTFGKSVAVADLDHDGRTDVAVTTPFSGGVTVFHNNGDGTFGEGILIAAPEANSVGSGDINSDGWSDLLVSDRGTVRTFFGTAAGFVAGSPTPLLSGNLASPACHDFDGDGHDDVVILDGYPFGFWVLLNDCPSPVPASSTIGLLVLALALGFATTRAVTVRDQLVGRAAARQRANY